MKLRSFFILAAICLASTLFAQISVAKIVGKNADKYKMGYGLFSYYNFPVGDVGNNSVRLELMDLVMFPSKSMGFDSVTGYISIKLGYKHIFSTESLTGFYIEPQLGYCRVATGVTGPDEALYGDGVAAAIEAGYSVEVGQRGRCLNFGLKYERDMAGKEHTISSIGFRFSYDFELFKKRRD